MDVNRRGVGRTTRRVATWVRDDAKGGRKGRRLSFRQELGARIILEIRLMGRSRKGDKSF